MMFRGRRYRNGTKILRPVRPNAGIEAMYRRELELLIHEMHEEVRQVVLGTYDDNEPTIAQDTTPADMLRAAVARMTRKWTERFDEAAGRLANYFSTAIEQRSSAAMRKILADGGWTVHFTHTPAMRDVFQATVNQNVSLIKTIPQQYLGDVEGMVQRSVQTGRDLGKLSADLQQKYGVTRRRAALIARDQNNKATSAFTRVRQQELGIEKAIWMHSHAGEVPRPTHVKMDGKEFEIKKGMYDKDEGEFVWPGQLINCRCTSRPVVEGFS